MLKASTRNMAEIQCPPSFHAAVGFSPSSADPSPRSHLLNMRFLFFLSYPPGSAPGNPSGISKSSLTPRCPSPSVPQPLALLPARQGSLYSKFSRRGALAYFRTGPGAPKIPFCLKPPSALGLGLCSVQSPVGDREFCLMSFSFISARGWRFRTFC